jgi:hypothetical protein
MTLPANLLRDGIHFQVELGGMGKLHPAFAVDAIDASVRRSTPAVWEVDSWLDSSRR